MSNVVVYKGSARRRLLIGYIVKLRNARQKYRKTVEYFTLANANLEKKYIEVMKENEDLKKKLVKNKGKHHAPFVKDKWNKKASPASDFVHAHNTPIKHGVTTHPIYYQSASTKPFLDYWSDNKSLVGVEVRFTPELPDMEPINLRVQVWKDGTIRLSKNLDDMGPWQCVPLEELQTDAYKDYYRILEIQGSPHVPPLYKAALDKLANLMHTAAISHKG